MKLHIITPCSRPENLQKIAESISNAYFEWYIEFQWWIVFDSDIMQFDCLKNTSYPTPVNLRNIKGGKAGKTQINYALDQITDGWVYVLDDDNLLNPDFPKFLETFDDKKYQGLIFSQQLGEGVFRHNNENNIKVCQIDQAQFLLKRSLIGSNRYLNSYEADGMFISKLFRENKDKFLITNEVLSYYNKLKW